MCWCVRRIWRRTKPMQEHETMTQYFGKSKNFKTHAHPQTDYTENENMEWTINILDMTVYWRGSTSSIFIIKLFFKHFNIYRRFTNRFSSSFNRYVHHTRQIQLAFESSAPFFSNTQTSRTQTYVHHFPWIVYVSGIASTVKLWPCDDRLKKMHIMHFGQ